MHISSTELLALDIRLAFSTHVQHTSALCLSNLFLERSVKHQAHYFSRLETRKTQLASCETRLETRFSKFSRIENRVSSRVARLASDCQLTFERYCIFPPRAIKYHKIREYSRGKWPTVSLSLTTFSANLSTALSSSCSA